MPPPPRPLRDELVEEILLRLPPDSPASLVYASLVCKHWCHLVSNPRFQRRFREHHRSPPIFGFLHTSVSDDGNSTAMFVPEPASGLRHVDHPRLRPLECRHGRVLLYRSHRYDTDIFVWDPITGDRAQLPKPPAPILFANMWTVAMLCTAAAPGGTCDHLDCHGGPFIVVLLVQDTIAPQISSFVYSSESSAWSEPIPSPHSGGWIGSPRGALLVRNALYFAPNLHQRMTILQYDLGTKKITAINLPNAAHKHRSSSSIELIATKDGGLGFAIVENTKLSLWSREVVGGGAWALCQVIDLDKLLPAVDALSLRASTPYLFGSADGTGVIFLRVGRRLFAVDLWSRLKLTELHKWKPLSNFAEVVPYMSFFTPVLSRPPCTDARPKASASVLECYTCSKTKAA